MIRRGVNYDVGFPVYGRLSRKQFDPSVVRREMQIIQSDLRCNAVRISGLDLDRLRIAALAAFDAGLEVWLSPLLYEATDDEMLTYLADASQLAEELSCLGSLVFVVGQELTLFMQGYIEGKTVYERVPNWEKSGFATPEKGVNDFLKRAVQLVRTEYLGEITYDSLKSEKVDWSLFDYVGVNNYRAQRNRSSYGEDLRPLFTFGKPVIVLELGCCTFQGAEILGGQGWTILDYEQDPGRLKGAYVRDEALQASEVVDMLRMVDAIGASGTFVYTFLAEQPHSDDPMQDNDMACYSLVKMCAAGPGATYPDVPWEPKASFRAVAQYFGSD